MVVLGQYGAVPVATWWYWVSIGQYRLIYIDICYRVSTKRNWLIYDNTGSVEGGAGYHLVVLGQYGAVLVGTWWH